MWNIQGKSMDATRFQSFEPKEVLYEFDGPRIFTLAGSDGELNLAYWSDGDQNSSRFVVVPTTTKILDFLRSGKMSVFDALNQPQCWVCDILVSGDVGNCWRVDFDSIPRDALPAAGIMLLPSLEPPLVDVEGRVRELDKDQLSFELREIHGPVQTQRFVFAEELLEDVFLAFQKEVRVRVAGTSISGQKNVAYALALSGESGNAADSIPAN